MDPINGDGQQFEELPFVLAERKKRFFAYLIDSLPLSFIVVFGYFAYYDFDQEVLLENQDWIQLINFVVYIIYSGIMDASSLQGSLGKHAMDIKVVNIEGQPLKIEEAIMRNLTKVISNMAFMLGFAWILIDPLNQGWHDKIAGAYLADKSIR
ncbi:MAG: RDD family protein [Bacteroidota bacterium]